MPKAALLRVAADFYQLAGRFQEYATRAVKPSHLLVDVEQSAVRAGRLLQEAANAGTFRTEKWWREGMLDGWSFSSESEQFSWLWTFAVGSLVKHHRPRFRDEAESWDWSHVATDEEGRPLGEDGKPLRRRWYKNGEPRSDDFCWNRSKVEPGKYERRLDVKPAKRTDFYGGSDTLAHLRVRAEVYADACRLLAEKLDSAQTAELPRADGEAGGYPESGQPREAQPEANAQRGQPQQASVPPTVQESKRSTEGGEARAKLIAALTKHHEYADGGCLKLEPIGIREVARQADVSPSSASRFFKKKFEGHAHYRTVCCDAGRLAESLKVLNGEFAPQELYGRNPPGEDGRWDD